MSGRCQGLAPRSCFGYPLRSGFCWMHDPAFERERREAQSRRVEASKRGRERRLAKARERDVVVRAVVDALRTETEDLIAARAIIGLHFVRVSAVGSAVGEPESGGDERIRTAE